MIALYVVHRDEESAPDQQNVEQVLDENEQNGMPHHEIDGQAENPTPNGAQQENGACNEQNNDSIAVSIANMSIDENGEFD